MLKESRISRGSFNIYNNVKRVTLTRNPFPTIQLTKIYHPICCEVASHG